MECSNILLDFSVEMVTTPTPQEVVTRRLLEQPEDLGSTRSGEPASLWQRRELFEALAAAAGVELTRGAFWQCEWGGTTPKPTGLLTDIPSTWSFRKISCTW